MDINEAVEILNKHQWLGWSDWQTQPCLESWEASVCASGGPRNRFLSRTERSSRANRCGDNSTSFVG